MTQLRSWHRLTHHLAAHTSRQCCLWFGCVLQIGGKHANFRPTGEAAGSDQAMFSSSTKHTHTNTHVQTCTHTKSEKGKTHQPELRLGEITAVVKILLLSSERHVSHKHFHTVNEVITQTYCAFARTQKYTRTHKHFLTATPTISCVNIYFKLNTFAARITCLIHKNNGPVGTRLAP